MLSKTTGENYVSELPTHVSQSLKLIQILRDNNSHLFDGYEDVLHTFHFSKQIILRAKRGILLKTPSMNGHFSYATHMCYETNNVDYSFVFNCLQDLLSTIDIQRSYKTIRVQEKIFNKVFCKDFVVVGKEYTTDQIPPLLEFEKKYGIKNLLHVYCEGEKYIIDEDSEYFGDEDDRYMEYVLFYQ